MKKIFTMLGLASTLFLTGCSPFGLINSQVYNNADLADYHTFRIVTPEMGHLPPGMEMVTYYNIAAAIREQMVERGFVEDPTSPLLINIALTVHREIATEPAIPPGYFPYNGPYYPYYMWPGSYYPPYLQSYYANAQVITGIYKEGVLTMDMVNIDEKIALFSASVGSIINNDNGQFRNLQSIAEAVQTLFSRFPVPLLPQYRHNK